MRVKELIDKLSILDGDLDIVTITEGSFEPPRTTEVHDVEIAELTSSTSSYKAVALVLGYPNVWCKRPKTRKAG